MFLATPSRIASSATTTVYLVADDEPWAGSAPAFTATGQPGASVASITKLTPGVCSLSLTTGAAAGEITFTDPQTGRVARAIVGTPSVNIGGTSYSTDPTVPNLPAGVQGQLQRMRAGLP